MRSILETLRLRHVYAITNDDRKIKIICNDMMLLYSTDDSIPADSVRGCLYNRRWKPANEKKDCPSKKLQLFKNIELAKRFYPFDGNANPGLPNNVVLIVHKEEQPVLPVIKSLVGVLPIDAVAADVAQDDLALAVIHEVDKENNVSFNFANNDGLTSNAAPLPQPTSSLLQPQNLDEQIIASSATFTYAPAFNIIFMLPFSDDAHEIVQTLTNNLDFCENNLIITPSEDLFIISQVPPSLTQTIDVTFTQIFPSVPLSTITPHDLEQSQQIETNNNNICTTEPYSKKNKHEDNYQIDSSSLFFGSKKQKYSPNVNQANSMYSGSAAAPICIDLDASPFIENDASATIGDINTYANFVHKPNQKKIIFVYPKTSSKKYILTVLNACEKFNEKLSIEKMDDKTLVIMHRPGFEAVPINIAFKEVFSNVILAEEYKETKVKDQADRRTVTSNRRKFK